MPLRANSRLMGLCIGVGLAFLPWLSKPCLAKNAYGDWVAKRDIAILGPNGPMEIRAGQLVNGELQGLLDAQCK
jgi:hypothetical protein